MIKKASFALLCAASLCATNAFSTTVHTFQRGISANYVLQPNEPQEFVNVFMWAVKATCKMTSKSEDTLMSIKVLRKSGSYNGMPLSNGDAIQVMVHNNEKIHLTAASGGKVELINLGDVTMNAECTAE